MIARLVALCAVVFLPTVPAADAQTRAGAAIDMLAGADGNHDGAVTQLELRGYRRDAFDRMDVNNDQRLSHVDVVKWARVMGSAGAQAQFDQFLATLDADHSGSISRAEFIGGPSLVFDLLDTDHNQTVDAAEFAAGRAALAAGSR